MWRLMKLTARVCGTLLLCIVSGAFLCTGRVFAQRQGLVEVRGTELLRDGRPWIPHGYYQIAFEVAPANLARADHPFWATAQNNYKPEEYLRMREAGADSVRLQISQAGADPQSPIYDRQFVEKAMGAVQAARDAGLTVILAVQDESHIPGDRPIDFPDDGTRRIWRMIAPRFAHDRGVLYELLNEPRPQPSAQNWARWKQAMTLTLAVVRRSGSENVIVADGLGVGQVIDGAPLLADPQVAYASHPYALHPEGQTPRVWDAKFGDFSRRAPVIITEWISGGYYCDANTASSSLQFLRYLQEHRVGLEIGVWDWAPGGFGSARWGFPQGRFSSFVGKSCHQPGFGLGEIVHTWYMTGVPPVALQ